jgi:hypothetical protein
MVGGPGSGNFGHAGRPGLVGGSASAGGSPSSPKSSPDSKNIGHGSRLGGHPHSESKRIKDGVPKEVKERKHGINEITYAFTGLEDMREDPPKCDRYSIPKNQIERNGRCFELAARFVMDNPDWEIVHATLYPRIGNFADQIYFHSYAQKGNIIFDPVFNQFYNADKHAKYYNTTDKRVYNSKVAIKKMLKSGNYGPWE